MPSKRASAGSALHRNSLTTSHKSAGDNMVTEDGYMLDYAILPRRKAGQVNASERCPVRLTKDVLEKYFGMPLIRASKELVSIIHSYFLCLHAIHIGPCFSGYMCNGNQESVQVAGSTSHECFPFENDQGFLNWAGNWEF